jgi:hypothetical protein
MSKNLFCLAVCHRFVAQFDGDEDHLALRSFRGGLNLLGVDVDEMGWLNTVVRKNTKLGGF